MAIRVSPLMGLGAIAQGYEQQRQEAARRQLIEEQLRAQALSRAAQGAIGATLTAPGGIGAGVGSSPYAGLSNLGGGGAGGGDPINAPPPGSAPNATPDSYGSGAASGVTSSQPDLSGNIGVGPRANATMTPGGSMHDRAMQVWRDLAAGNQGSPEFQVPGAGGMGPQGAVGPPGGGGQQQPFNPADLLNPAKSLEFASQIAMRVKAANPNASNEVIAQATTDLMKSIATQDRLGTMLAIAQMKDITTQRGQNITSDTRTNVANIGAGSRENVANIGAGSRENVANIGAKSRENVANIGATSREKVGAAHDASREKVAADRLKATQERWKQVDAEREQKRQDGLRRGDATDYKQSINAELHELQSELGNPARRNPLEPEEIAARESRVRYLIGLLQQTQVRTRPQQQPTQQPSQ